MYDISDEYIKLIERRFMEKRSTPIIIKNSVNGS